MMFSTPRLSIAGLFFLLAGAVSSPAVATETADGRFGTLCMPYRHDNVLCMTSMYRLIASPEKYHGKYVQVVGYLNTARGGPALCASEASFENIVPLECLTVRGTLPSRVADAAKGGTWVMVVARFDGKYEGAGSIFLGALTDVVSIGLWGNHWKLLNKP